MNDFSTTQEDRVRARLRGAGDRLSRGDFSRNIATILSDGTDSFFTVDSPLGLAYVGIGQDGIRYINPRPQSDEEFAQLYGETFGRLVVPAEGDELEEMRDLISAALNGEKVEVPVDLGGRTDFQRRVLEVVRRIPRGEVRPYGWVAEEAGNPRASRAVGTVMANNPIPLVIPCHRVIKNDGSPGNYGFDPADKVRLLRDEGVPLDDVARAPYVATPTTGVVCHATCHNARRIKPENRREFRSMPRAVDAGFRPCKVCRPSAVA